MACQVVTSREFFLAIPVPLEDLGARELKNARQRVNLQRVPDGVLQVLMLKNAFLLFRESGDTLLSFLLV